MNIGIIGSCVSRDLFNDPRLKDLCKVVFYAFQNNIWDMGGESLNIPKAVVDRIPLENFTRRMVDYDLNKSALKNLFDQQVDFVMIDMFVIWRECLKITCKNKVVYLKNNRVQYIKDFLQSELGKQYNYEIVQYSEVDETIIKNGLERLAILLTSHFDGKQIVLHYPIFAKRYWNLNNKIINYSEKDRNNALQRIKIIEYWTDYLASLIPGSIKFKPAETNLNSVARFLSTDNITLLPNPVHLSQKDIAICVNELLPIINEDGCKKSLIDTLNNCLVDLNNKYILAMKAIEKVSGNITTSLNNYISKQIDLERQIVVISTKNQASEYIHKFYMKTKLGIQLNVNHSESYVCIIDRLNKYVVEKTDKNDACLCYSISGLEIRCDSNFTQNKSSIIINGVEYSKNRRGLNFVIIDRKTKKIISSFWCDTYADENLLITL